MKTSEAALWRWLAGARRAGYHLERVENSLSRSTPDVECSTGKGGFWVELKTADRSKRASTKIRFRFQQGQSKWLGRRWDVDRCAWLLVQVGPARYMVQGNHAWAVEHGLTEAEIEDLSIVRAGAGPAEMLEAASGVIWNN